MTHHKACTHLFLSLELFLFISRSIWTSAPGFLSCPEAGRSPFFRAPLPSFSIQLAITALRLNHYFSIMKSSWRGQNPSEFSGYKDPTRPVWLPHKVPAIFRHHPIHPPTAPVDRNIMCCRHLLLKRSTTETSHHYHCLLITGRTLGLMLPFSAKNCSGTREGGTSLLSNCREQYDSVSCSCFGFPTHFLKMFFLALHIQYMFLSIYWRFLCFLLLSFFCLFFFIMILM